MSKRPPPFRPVARSWGRGGVQSTLAVVSLLLLAATATAQSQPSESQPQSRPALASRLEKLLSGHPADTRIGLAVLAADSGRVLFAHDADTPLKPASLQKLLVTAAALERFGADFRYETRVYLQGSELWIVGAGDPSLGDDRVAERRGQKQDQFIDDWTAALRTRNVTELSGIVLDDTVFEPPGRHFDWPEDQSDRWYQAPVGGLNLNDNCLDINIKAAGGAIQLELQPNVPADWVHSRLKLGKRQRPVVRRPANQDAFELSGTIVRGGALPSVSVRQPTDFFGAALRHGFEQRGLTVRGSVVQQPLRAGSLPDDQLVATYTTPLPDILWRCNRFSQNLFGECLLKTLAAYEPSGRRASDPGSWEAGRDVLCETLSRIGVDLDSATIRDGSGLSHYNRVTASQFATLLYRMRTHRHADVFLASLAEPGEPGSMAHRYDDPALRGRLRGKTGTITGVRCLAGYLTRPDGTVLTFALLINGEAPASLLTEVSKAILAGE